MEKMPTIYLAEKGEIVGRLSSHISNVARGGFVETDHYLVADLRRNAQSILDEIDTWTKAGSPPESRIVEIAVEAAQDRLDQIERENEADDGELRASRRLDF